MLPEVMFEKSQVQNQTQCESIFSINTITKKETVMKRNILIALALICWSGVTSVVQAEEWSIWGPAAAPKAYAVAASEFQK